MTPEYSGVIERLFERFLQYLVSQDLIGRQQAAEIMTHRASLERLSSRGYTANARGSTRRKDGIHGSGPEAL
jgi:hypothetical protein